ncbi:uncharacterized protein LOC124147989 [Haliotis rufescens]|uniref:uncharacterized protein LOC124147989 n=1 Tax=Haliotis rufescens TaxID=6454 RepID=UPI00201F55E4|nr:uncharacterized protein LOC124147989 [Haliotis rufescens]
MEVMTLLVKVVLVIIGLFPGKTLVYIVAGLQCGVLVITIIVIVLYNRRKHMSLLANGGSLRNQESPSGNVSTEMETSNLPTQRTGRKISDLYTTVLPRAMRTKGGIQTNANRDSPLPTDATGYIDMTSKNVTTSVDAITHHLYSDVARETPAVKNDGRILPSVYENIS